MSETTDDRQAMLESARRWVDEVNDAYDDGGYAQGDGPETPLDEMEWLLAELERVEQQRDRYRRALKVIAAFGGGKGIFARRVLDGEDGQEGDGGR